MALKRFFIALCILLQASTAAAKDFKLAVEHGNEDLYDYAISLIRLAVSKQPENTFETIKKPGLTQGRLFDMLMSKQEEFNLVIASSRSDYLKKSFMVEIPISRGLLGNRFFVINREKQSLFDSIDSLESLKKLVTVGSGYQWIDTDVFRHNGFKVQVAEFEQLYKMLQKNRYEGFNRGMFEAYPEVEIFKPQHPDIMVYPNILVSYKFDYFYFTKTQELRDELQSALEHLYESGEFLSHFHNHPHIKNSLDKVNANKPKVFYLENPFSENEFKDIPAHYWHDVENLKR